MSKRATDLIGKPVVSANTGEKLGTVSDLLIDEAGHGIVGLVLRHGLMKAEDVLPAEAVQTLGTDAIVSRTGELIGAKEWNDRRRESDSGMRTTPAGDDGFPEE
jgi:uncharacterized protein YrrD